MKVLDESGVKKIVNDYKTADDNIISTTNKISNALNNGNSRFRKLTTRVSALGFATYGASNYNEGLVIPIDADSPNCFIIEGTGDFTYGKIYIERNTIIVRTNSSKASMDNLVAITKNSRGDKYLIVAEGRYSEPVVIKPILDSINEIYINYSQILNNSFELGVSYGTLEDMARDIGDGTVNKFTCVLESDL